MGHHGTFCDIHAHVAAVCAGVNGPRAQLSGTWCTWQCAAWARGQAGCPKPDEQFGTPTGPPVLEKFAGVKRW